MESWLLDEFLERQTEKILLTKKIISQSLWNQPNLERHSSQHSKTISSTLKLLH